MPWSGHRHEKSRLEENFPKKQPLAAQRRLALPARIAWLPIPRMSDVSSSPLSAAATAPAGPVRKDAVLLIEDNETIAGLLKALMRSLGLRVYWCAEGAEALRLFQLHRHEIRLVLADCRLPDSDGREVCVKLRELEPDLPVLVTSGSVSGRGVAPLPRCVSVDYLPKPYAPSEVLARVRRLLAHSGGGPAPSAGLV